MKPTANQFLKLEQPSSESRRLVNQSRRGSSLIEMVAVIGLVATLLSTSAYMFHQATNTYRVSLLAFRELEQLNRWYDQFRSDSQQANNIELQTETDLQLATDTEAALILQRGDGITIRYQLRDQRLTRQLERDGQVISQEAWQAWLVDDLQWNIERSGRLTLVSCSIQFSGDVSQRQEIEWFARGPVVAALSPPASAASIGAGNDQ